MMTEEYIEVMDDKRGVYRHEVGGSHYERMKIQPTEYIHANKLDFFEGNVIKYITRRRFKNGAEDVKKAVDYCLMILENDYGIKYEQK